MSDIKESLTAQAVRKFMGPFLDDKDKPQMVIFEHGSATLIFKDTKIGTVNE
jgi:hypothetical protein